MPLYNHSGLQFKLFEAGIVLPKQTLIRDRLYRGIPMQWLVKEFMPWFHDKMLASWGADYKAEAFDCENFSDLFVSMAQLAYSYRKDAKGSSLAIGVFGYKQETGSGHAIVVAVTHNGNVIFIEPQRKTGAFVELSEEEKRQCLHAIF